MIWTMAFIRECHSKYAGKHFSLETINRNNQLDSLYMTDLERHHMVHDLVGLQETDMIQSIDIRLKESQANSALDIQKLSYNVIGYVDDLLLRNLELKGFLFRKLYRPYRVVWMKVKAEHIITDLFTSYLTEPLILPDHIQ
jgi:dGTPase